MKIKKKKTKICAPNNVCKICFISELDMKLLSENKTLLVLLENITKKKLSYNANDSKICKKCAHYLKKFTFFQNMCLKSNEYWKRQCLSIEKGKTMAHKVPLIEQDSKMMCDLKVTEILHVSLFSIDNVSENEEFSYYVHKIKSEAEKLKRSESQNEKSDNIPLVHLKNEYKQNVFTPTSDNVSIDDNINEDFIVTDTMNDEIKEDLFADEDYKILNPHNYKIKLESDIIESGHLVGKAIKEESQKEESPKKFNNDFVKKNRSHKSSLSSENCDDIKISKQIRQRFKINSNEGLQLNLNIKEQIQELEERAQDEKYLEAEFKCSKCVIIFRSESTLSTHMEKHSEASGSVVCQVCQQRFQLEVQLTRHSLCHSLRVDCQLCGVRTKSRSAFIDHLASHKGQLFHCEKCEQVFRKRHTLRVHREKVHGVQNYKCKFCPKTFHWKNAYTIHELTHEKNRTFPCVECGRVLQNEYFLKKHLKKHQNKRDSYCVECDVHFVNLTALRGHYATVARHRQPEALTFSCDKCPKRYETEKELSRHVQNFHERVARFSCEKCGQGYATRTGLLHHTKKAHLGYKLPLKYTCIECDKSFTTKTQLTAHMRKHTGEQPFQCDQCLRKFSQRSSMRTHIKLVHLKMKRNRSGKGNPWGTLPNTDSIQEKDDSVQDSSVVQLNVDKFSADNIMKDETGIR